MNTLRNKIYESALYNAIVALCQFATKSFFLKPQMDMAIHEKKEIFKHTAIHTFLVWLGKVLEKLFIPIRTAWNKSILVGLFNSIRVHLMSNSVVGKFVKEINIIYLMPLFVYLDFFIRGYLPSFASLWDELFYVFMVMWIIVRRIIGNKRYVFTSLDLPIIFFAGVYLILLLINSPELDVAVEGYRAVVQYIFWFFIVVQLVDTKKIAYRMIWLFIIGIGLLGLHGMYQYFTGAEMLGNWVDAGESISTRAYSIIKSPNAFASLLVLNIPIAFSMFVAEKDILKRLVALFCTLSMGLGLLFTFTRAAWMFCFLSILVFLFFVGKRMIIPISSICIAAAINVNAIWSRISYLFTPEYKSKSARGGRTFRYATGLSEWAESKVVGLGIGRYGGAVATNHKLSPFYMDNYYLKTLTESGIVGLSAFVILLMITLRQIYLSIKNTITKESRILMYGMFTGVLAVLGHNFVENIFETPFMVTYFWTIVALILAMNRLDKPKDA